MGLLHLAVAALLASTVYADDDCACVEANQSIDHIDHPMIFFQQPTKGGKPNGVSCSTNCTMIATADTKGENGMKLQLLSISDMKSSEIKITDGPRTFVINKNSVQSDFTWASTGGVLKFEFTESSDVVGMFMIVVQSSERDEVPPEEIITSPAPTVPYDHKRFLNNPLLVSQDIMIDIDLSSEDLAKFKNFAVDLINELTITDDEKCGAGTRLAVHGLSSFSSFAPTYFPDWKYQKENALGNIKAMTQIGVGSKYFIDPAVKDFVKKGFKIKDDEPVAAEPDRCYNRGRFYILFTSTEPSEYKSEQGTANPWVDFIERGVHPILVSPLRDGKRGYYDTFKTRTYEDGSNRWSYFNVDDGVDAFINNYLVNANNELSCQLQTTDAKNQTKVILTKDHEKGVGNAAIVAIPPYYNAKKTTAGDNDNKQDTAWDTIKHYCNFQKTTVEINYAKEEENDAKKQDVCITVFYDLDTGKDFVSIFSGDITKSGQKEVVRLTGRDVSGTTFRLGSRMGSIVFTSNERDVYDGFYAEIYPCGAAVQ